MNPRRPPIAVERDGPVTRVLLDRPEVSNALDAGLIREIAAAFTGIARDKSTRVVVLGGRGRSFCSGADLGWLKGMVDHSREEHRQDAALLQSLFHTIHSCPRPVIGRIHGAALGGGTGLAAVCDIAVAAPEARFGAVEMKFWLLPAVIAPYLVEKVGPAHTRRFFLTGERFSAARAARIGLVQHVVPAGELDAFIARTIDRLLATGPRTLAAAKSLIHRVAGRDPAGVRAVTLDAIDAVLSTREGRREIDEHLARRGIESA